MKVFHCWRSLVSHTRPTALLNPSISTTTTDAESSSRREWVKKSKQILLVNNSRDISSELMAALTRTVLPWNRESSVTTESDFSYLPAPPVIELKEKENVREDQSEDALLVPISRLFPLPSLKRVRRKFQDLPTIPDLEDWVQKEPPEFVSFMVSKRWKEKKLSLVPALWSRSTSSEELLTAKRLLMPNVKKLQRSKDWSLKQDSEEREFKKKIKLKDGKDLLLSVKSTRKFMMPMHLKREQKLRREKPQEFQPPQKLNLSQYLQRLKPKKLQLSSKKPKRFQPPLLKKWQPLLLKKWQPPLKLSKKPINDSLTKNSINRVC